MMNLRNWSKQHTYGLILGILTTLIAIPLVIFILAKFQNYTFENLWYNFINHAREKARILSLASIANLIWFHRSLGKENFSFTSGVILATILNLALSVYFKFFA